jgi:hypothetical protein
VPGVLLVVLGENLVCTGGTAAKTAFRRRDAIDVPLVLVGGDSAETAFGSLFPDLAVTVRDYGWSNVKTELVKDSGRYQIRWMPKWQAIR